MFSQRKCNIYNLVSPINMCRLELPTRPLRTYRWRASAVVTVGQDLIQSNCERPNVGRKRKLLLLQALDGIPIKWKNTKLKWKIRQKTS